MGKLYSQDSVHVFNVHAMVIHPPTPISPSSATVAASFTLVVYLSMDKPDSTMNVNILVGNAMDNGVLANEQLVIIHHANIPCMHKIINNNEVCRFYNKNTKFELVLNQVGLAQLKYVTVYAKHKNGNYSQKKYFKIQ